MYFVFRNINYIFNYKCYYKKIFNKNFLTKYKLK